MDFAARLYLSHKYSVKPLRRHVSRLKVRSYDKSPSLKVAAAQVEFRLHRTAVEYFEHMRGLAQRAAEEGALLIAYPENVHLPLYGLIPGIERKFSRESSSKGEEKKIRDSLLLLGPFIKGIYFETFSSIARLYKMYVMGGSITAPEDGDLYNTAYLFAPDGRLIGSQKKLHITPDEEAFGLKAGDELKVYQLPFGKVAFPVCMDATYYETFEIARQKGADIVIVPIANMEEYEFYRALRGIWPRVQESRVFGIKSALVGGVSKFYFTGKAGIFAPIHLTEKKDGVIGEADHYLGDNVVIAGIDVEALRKYREQDPLLKDRNEHLYEKYLSSLYNKFI